MIHTNMKVPLIKFVNSNSLKQPSHFHKSFLLFYFQLPYIYHPFMINKHSTTSSILPIKIQFLYFYHSIMTIISHSPLLTSLLYSPIPKLLIFVNYDLTLPIDLFDKNGNPFYHSDCLYYEEKNPYQSMSI